MQQIEHILGRDIAGRARRKRASADPPAARIDDAHARLHRSVNITDSGIAGVVEVHAQRRVTDDWAQLLDEITDIRRHRDADRIGERDFVDARIDQSTRDVADDRGVDFTFERTTEGGGNAHAEKALRRLRTSGQIGNGGVHFGGSGALVASAKRIGGDGNAVDLIDVRSQRALEATRIEHEPDVLHIGTAG